ncbi:MULTISPECIES: four-helix bundle copper-binding protein [unclassified Clostridium]|uniref:four-helix bundle copper-binding protein n=1 Tax=unclassified Clostridium TaxID=2614128 RepID=UPI0002984D14|nr:MULTISPECIES: four-helix bundle copper-binding protein [unclassified Clostridium]EKQ51882.1 MAG: hypothetical protein A370_04498 [Clostridium sp. Maddingley MBC34-26]
MQSTMIRQVDSLILGGNPMQSCIDSCTKCLQICQECLNLCLHEDDVKQRMNCIKTLQDCSEICVSSVCFMSRSSENMKDICNTCATICDKCATECSMFTEQHCQTCADVCRQCANECRNMMNM